MSRRRYIRSCIGSLLAAAMVFAADAEAAPAPLGSEALYHWLVNTAAQALKASERDNDLRPGGLLAVNQGAKKGLGQISALTPAWFADVEAHLTMRDDLSTVYGLRASRALYTAPREIFLIDTFGRLDIDHAGRTSGELGLGVETAVDEHPFEVDVSGIVDQEWLRRREHYGARLQVKWWRFSMTAIAFNETTMDEPSGALYEERLLDGFDLDLTAGLPLVPWLSIATAQAYRAPTAPNAAAWQSSRHSIRLTPLNGLVIEAGTEESGSSDATWFTRVRYALKLGA